MLSKIVWCLIAAFRVSAYSRREEKEKKNFPEAEMDEQLQRYVCNKIVKKNKNMG